MTTVGVGATEPPAGAAAAEGPGTPRFRTGRRPQEFADALVPTVQRQKTPPHCAGLRTCLYA